MCFPVQCQKCGKTTWQGCGLHVDAVMSKVPVDQRCTCKKGEVKTKPLPKQAEPKDLDTIANITSPEEFSKLTNIPNLTIVDFFAPWCGPCKSLHPIFEKLSLTYKDVNFCRVNGDENDELVEQLEVSSYPTIMFYKDGKQVFLKNGFLHEDEFEELIKKYN